MVNQYAVIEAGVVVNIALAEADFAADQGWVALPYGVTMGWSYDGASFSAPSHDPAPIPASISFAQLLIGLVTEEWVTEAEGEAWLVGTLPGPVLALIASLPADQQFAAKARAIRPSEVLRQDPLVVALGTYTGKTEAEIDNFFRVCAQA